MIPISPSQFQMLLVLIVTGGVCAAAYGAQHVLPRSDASRRRASRCAASIVHVGQYEIDPNHFSDALIFPAAIVGMWCLRARLARRARGLHRRLGAAGRRDFAERLARGRDGAGLDRGVLFLALALPAQTGDRDGGVALLGATVQTSVFIRFASAWETGRIAGAPRSGPSRWRLQNTACCRVMESETSPRPSISTTSRPINRIRTDGTVRPTISCSTTWSRPGWSGSRSSPRSSGRSFASLRADRPAQRVLRLSDRHGSDAHRDHRPCR